MPIAKRVTHRDVARLAGVSTAVVSYVLNNGPRGTSPETRQRVLRAIEQLDYHPSAVARGLRAQCTRTIGFIVNDYFPLDLFLSPYSASILTGLTAELMARGYYVLIYPVTMGEDLSELEAMLRSGRLDGVVTRLIQDPPETDSLLEVIAASRVPGVLIERPGAEHFGFSTVSYDNEAGAKLATHYLIERGHRRIAHLAGDLRYVSARARRAGYQQALTENGQPIDDALVQGLSWAPSDAVAGMRRLLETAEPPTAVFAASDNLAFCAIEVLRQAGYRVPDDVAVVGFDDIPLAQEMTPPLTTVRIPLEEIGRKAADTVLSLTTGDVSSPKMVYLPVELMRRGTA